MPFIQLYECVMTFTHFQVFDMLLCECHITHLKMCAWHITHLEMCDPYRSPADV